MYGCNLERAITTFPYLEPADTGMPLADKFQRLLIVSSEAQCWCDEPFIIGKEVRIQVWGQGHSLRTCGNACQNSPRCLA